MADGQRIHDWNQTSLLAVLIANPNRDTKKHPKEFTVEDFHPYLDKESKKPVKPNPTVEDVGSFLDGLALAFGAKPKG